MKKFLVYSGYGTSDYCLKELVGFLDRNGCSYELITASQIRSNYLDQNQDAVLCFGGGFDLGFLSSLSQEGCKNIQNFVSSGGAYLGICAGAYFACKQIEFDLNGPLEVKGERLGLFDGIAKGPINKKFAYNCEDHCAAVKLRVQSGEQAFSYLNGGCYFEPSGKYFSSLLTYCYTQNEQAFVDCDGKMAVLEARFGMGKCVLSGVHFEIDTKNLDTGNENIKRNVLPILVQNQFDIGHFILNLF